MVTDLAELGVAWLLGTDPADRALAGWAPSAYVRQQYAHLLAALGGAPLHPGIPLAGRFRMCSDGHELVSWYGDLPCWIHPGPGLRPLTAPDGPCGR